jgi:hypothetical protein
MYVNAKIIHIETVQEFGEVVGGAVDRGNQV